MLRVLLKTRLEILFHSMVAARRRKSGKAAVGRGSIVLYALLLIYAIAVFGGLFGMLFSQLAKPFAQAELGWLYFALAGTLALALSLIGSVFSAQSQLYEAKDNEMLLSLPIPPRMILVSRMMLIFLLNLLFTALVAVPVGVVYAMQVGFGALGLGLFILSFLLIPLLSMALSAALAWLVALITSRMRRKQFFTLALSMAFLAAYFYFYSQMNGYMEYLVTHGAEMAGAFQKSLTPLYHLGRAIADQSATDFALFVPWCILPFVLVVALLSANFIRIVTTNRGAAKVKYRAREMRVRGVRSALIHKELGRFFGSAVYMMNAGIGVVMIFAAAVFLCVKRDLYTEISAAIPMLANAPAALLSVVVCGLCSMCFISAPSISLEGKSLWIPQSIPIDGTDALFAKFWAHMIIVVPPVLAASAILSTAFLRDAASILMMFAAPIAMTAFVAMLGVFMNLRVPRFDWISEAAAVKQGMSGMLTMFGSMFVILIPSAAYGIWLYQWLSPNAALFGLTMLLTLLTVILALYLKKKGAEKFALLGQ